MAMSEKIKIFLLGAIVALLAVVIFGRSSLTTPVAHAADGTAYGDGILAVASGDNLYLINTATKNIAYYNNKSSKFSLRAGRYYKYDIGLVDENKDGGITVKDAQKAAEGAADEIRKLEK